MVWCACSAEWASFSEFSAPTSTNAESTPESMKPRPARAVSVALFPRGTRDRSKLTWVLLLSACSRCSSSTHGWHDYGADFHSATRGICGVRVAAHQCAPDCPDIQRNLGSVCLHVVAKLRFRCSRPANGRAPHLD